MKSTSIKKTLAPENKKGAVWLARPFQLVSLWDMFVINGNVLYNTARRLESLFRYFSSETDQLPNEDREGFLKEFKGLIVDFQDLELMSSIDQAERIVELLSREGATYTEVKALIPDLQSRTQDALKQALMLFIETRNARFYTDEFLFGKAVADRLPSSILDIEEAGKCMAVGRYTACVFHLMRVMETGVKAFALELGILGKVKSAQPSWGEVLRLTNEEIQAKNKGNDLQWTPEKRGFFENIQADLMTVKNAWRNTTMHVENSYDEERAEDIFNSVKAFMRHLAKHLDESGNYTP